MAQELGKIERPTAESFEGTRKIFLIPLVYAPAEPPADYLGVLERYWAGVGNQLRRLVERTGPLRHVYHDAVFQEGDAGQVTIERLNPRGNALIGEYIQAGARVEAFEDQEVLAELVDWERVLMLPLSSRKVADLATNGYREATRRRREVLAQRIDQTLKPGESGLLLTPEEHGIQFPRDIQVFYIAPPALDEIHRWLRDEEQRERQAADAARTMAPEKAPEGAAGQSAQDEPPANPAQAAEADSVDQGPPEEPTSEQSERSS